MIRKLGAHLFHTEDMFAIPRRLGPENTDLGLLRMRINRGELMDWEKEMEVEAGVLCTGDVLVVKDGAVYQVDFGDLVSFVNTLVDTLGSPICSYEWGALAQYVIERVELDYDGVDPSYPHRKVDPPWVRHPHLKEEEQE